MGIETGHAHDTGAPRDQQERDMPNGVYPVPKFRPRADRRPRSAAVRLRVWWHRLELDEQLAAGAQPVAGSLLHHRAEQLGSRAERAKLARALEATLRAARRAPTHRPGLQLRHGEIRACDEDILALIRRLDDERPIDVQGAALVAQLLSDPSGPLSRAGATSLRYAVRSARLALDHADEAALAMPEAA
jgi:hypothetical protein